jgi:DNA-binding IclR family transcriptional regulator
LAGAAVGDPSKASKIRSPFSVRSFSVALRSRAMSLDQQVLAAMLRLARHGRAAEDDEVALRVGEPPSTVRSSMRRLQAAGLVELRMQRSARLTFSGLAIAVALVRSTPRVNPSMNAASRAA